MSKLIVMTLCYQDASSVINLSKTGLQAAADTFQKSMLRGIEKNSNKDIVVINCIPVGTWPRQYKKLILCDNIQRRDNVQIHNIGCINLPVVKQLGRSHRIHKLLNMIAEPSDKVLIYSAYAPFLKAVTRYKKCESTVVITDLPEYYDNQAVSWFRRFLRKANNKKIYDYLGKINKFVLLTEQMKEPLKIGDRPYVVVEGICDTNIDDKHVSSGENKRVLFYSGTLSYKFGIMVLVDAFQKMKDKDVELWICGSGEAGLTIQETAERNSRIKYFGFCTKERVQELRAQATVLVNPRKNEGEYTKYSFPSKTMEYMASGIPVIMYKLDGILDEYDDYLYYVDGKEEDGLQKIIEKVLELSPAEREVFGNRAKEFVRSRKSEIAQSCKILDLLYNKTIID